MSQRARGYECKALDLYDTPAWVVAALLPHLPGVGAVWEQAAGSGKMIEALRRHPNSEGLVVARGMASPARRWEADMQIARYINIAVWFYVWASDILNPAVTTGDFWTEKAKQALRLNQNIDDPFRLLGNAIIPLVLWLVIDLFLQWLQRLDQPPTDPTE
jgi:hypothetical protein